jgi:hypothetical protein
MSYKFRNVIQLNLKNVNVLVLGLAMHMSKNTHFEVRMLMEVFIHVQEQRYITILVIVH